MPRESATLQAPRKTRPAAARRSPVVNPKVTTVEIRELMDLRGQIEAINMTQAVIEFELDGTIISARARAEGDITTFLMEWIGGIPVGDREAVDRFIHLQHPAYASPAAMTFAELRARVEEIARIHRLVETHGLGSIRGRDKRQGEL